ncbi:MAG: hypothetical protein WC505_05245 [Patescibacteria group bacterium]
MTIIRKRPELWWAALFGALPDVILAVYGVYRYGWAYFRDTTDQKFGKKAHGPFVKVYYFTHSLVPITFVALLLLMVEPHYAIVTIPYYVHVLLDSFVHGGIWAARLLYPISAAHFNGSDWWKNKWISVGNWSALVLVNIVILYFS